MNKAGKSFLYMLMLVGCFSIISCDNKTENQKKEPVGTQVEKVVINKQIGGTPEDLSQFSVSMEYPKVKGIDSSLTTIIIQQESQKRMNKGVVGDTIYKNYETVITQLENAYGAFRQDFPEVESKWFLERKLDIAFENAQYLTLMFYEHSYLGGAHPSELMYYTTYDKTTGNKLGLHKLLNSSELIRVTELAQRAFNHQKGLKVGDDYQANGWFFPNNEFTLPNNYCLTDSSLVLFYNRYDIGSYAAGATRLEIEVNEFKKETS